MRYPYLRRLATVAMVALFAASALAAPARQDRKATRRPAGEDMTTSTQRRPTLDDLTAATEMTRMPDGSYQWRRTFKHAIPWEEYLAALQAEGEWEYDFSGDRPVMRRKDASEINNMILDLSEEAPDPSGTFDDIATAVDASVQCVPPDSDYDGDSFTMTTNPQDTFPLRFGEYVADRPRVVANFTSYIEPGIDVHYNATNTDRFEAERFFLTDLQEKLTVIETREVKKKFNSSFGFKWAITGGAIPVLSLDLGVSYERSYEYKWTREKTRTVQEKFTSLRKMSQENTVTVGPNAGRVSGQVTMSNVSDYAIDVDISNIRIAVVSYSPFTGQKYALGDVALASAFTLGFGAGNNSASAFVLLQNLNSLDMMNRLAEGWVFDMEMASYTAVQNGTGTSLSAIISRVNQRNARLSIHFGDATPRMFGQVSLFQPGNECLTGEDLLRQFVGAENVEFERLANGTLVVKRIYHRTNRFAEAVFDDLAPGDQAQYGRWVVGFDFYSRPDVGFDLETTLLMPEDKIYFYYVTVSDLIDPPRPPDEVNAIAIANDGTSPASMMVTDVSTFDTVELNIGSDFQIHSAYTQFVGDVAVPGCGPAGLVLDATYWGHQVTSDSNIHNVTVPNIDWYGVQVNFGGRGWQPLANILADPAARANVTQNGYPAYDFRLQFLVTPAMLANNPTSSLQVRNNKPRQTFSVGYTGRFIFGITLDCRSNVTTGFYRNTGDLKVWYKLDNVDGDLDTFYAVASTGIDFDDANDRRFPYAPEHLDGVDNDGDGSIDEEPMTCPVSLRAYDPGTCALDNRMGWYAPSPNTLFEQRFGRSDGTFTGWETVASGVTSFSFLMNSDPTVVRMEVRATYYPPSGPSRSGVSVIYKAAGGDVPIFNVGPEFQAEAGKVVPPMRVDTSGVDTYVHTPVGSWGPSSASADYRINVTATGDYYIWTKVAANNDSDDSFFVTVYDSLGMPVDFGFGSQAHFRLEACNPAYPHGPFGWTRVGHWNPYVTPEQNMNPIKYRLNPGIYLIRVQPRELGTKLDKLRVERDCLDADLDGYTVCEGDCNDANPDIRPDRSEVCGNSVDDDCDGYTNEGCGGGGSVIFKKIIE